MELLRSPHLIRAERERRRLESLNLRAIEDQRCREINHSLDGFVAHLNQTAQTLTKAGRQKIVRLLAKQIDVGEDMMTIHHSILVQ